MSRAGNVGFPEQHGVKQKVAVLVFSVLKFRIWSFNLFLAL